ncbi:MAG TPA: globin domain-containing protein [Acidimicrobiales bacterium]|nr:globin domain-containing protein [Acidimicrobiales bacterium]
MTPRQIEMVEGTLDAVSLPALSADFYRRAFDTDPELARMFTADRRVQEARFATELAAIVRSIRCHDEFVAAGRALGARHRGYGVMAAHYRVMGDALLASLAAALGPAWNAQTEEAWRLAYNLTAETMLSGARAPVNPA